MRVMRKQENKARTTLMAVALIAALIAALALTGCQIGQVGRRAQPQSATLTPAPAPSGWTVVTDPAVARQAPASVRTLYRASIPSASGQSFAVQRSDDAGATWSDKTWPRVAGAQLPADVTDTQTLWSPRAPLTMFLWLQLKDDALCPLVDQYPEIVINGIVRVSSTTGKLCQMYFVTDDGGATWRQLLLLASLAGGVTGNIDTGALPTSSSLNTQGSRIYALFNASAQNTPAHVRLGVSDDGGAIWRLADGAIAAAGQEIFDYTTTSTGKTLFALTQPAGFNTRPASGAQLPPVQIWASDDGGATWKAGGTPPGQRMDGLSAAVDPSTGGTVAYLLSDSESDIDLHLYASLDGGHTWPHTVDLNAKEDSATSLSMLTTLPNGALALFNGEDQGANSSSGSGGANEAEALSAWQFNLGAVWTLTQPAGVSQVTQVGIQTAPSGGTRLWLAGEDANGGQNLLEYTAIY